ncbi:hypothetical protein A3715_16735 [Oleiphilus sp. HI0009]|nr:hypothetical protein A3715_16735 [Oleiphilus sp. HI0009]
MPHSVKLLYIIDSFTSPYAGTEGQLYKLVEGLDRNHFQPHLILFNRSEYIEENGFPCCISVLGYSKLSSLITWWQLFKMLKQKKREGYRLAHIFFNDPSVIAPPLLKILGIKSIISRRDMGYWYTPSYLKALRFNAKLVNVVAVNSEAVKQITCQNEGYSSRQVEVIYNGYEDTFIDPENCIDLRKQENELVLGIVANIRPIKRMQDAVAAISQLNKSGFNVRLVIVGGGDSSELINFSHKLGVEDKLDCVGSQSSASDYIQGFDICLLCSKSEGFSNAIVEYMRHGKPVVCSAVGGNPECVDDGKTGLLYPTGDVPSLVASLELLCNDELLRKKFGAAGEAKVKKMYGMSMMLGEHEALYSSLAPSD